MAKSMPQWRCDAHHVTGCVTCLQRNTARKMAEAVAICARISQESKRDYARATRIMLELNFGTNDPGPSTTPRVVSWWKRLFYRAKVA